MTRPIPPGRPGEPMERRPAVAHRGPSRPEPGRGGPGPSVSGRAPGDPHGRPAQPASTLDRIINNLDRNLSARGIEQTPGEREFDEAATVDVALDDLGLEEEGRQAEDATSRAQVSEMSPPRQPDGDNETVRLHISELQKLVTASVDPELDK